MPGVRMWPRQLPRQIRENSLRSAEVRVYDLLEQALGPEWTVFYSRPWLGITPSGEEKDGECDFVVVHPARGFLALEVKGGGISQDPETGQWISTDRNRIRHRIKNPLQQAVSSKYALLEKVKEMASWPGRYIRKSHGVIFPDTETPPRDLGPDGPREIFCCRDDLPDISGWVRQRLSHGSGQELGEMGVRAFEELLAAPINLRVPLGHYLEDDEQQIATLTPQQFHILDSNRHLERMAAGGGAGTGKTIVALEDAARFAREGLRTIVLCRSEPLALHLAQRMSKAEPSVTVRSLGAFCSEAAARYGQTYVASDNPEKGIECLLNAVRQDPEFRFDAIVVDEAQDFRTHWWIAIEELLADPKKSSIHAYYDTNQNIYGDITSELRQFQIIPIYLNRNLRNTRTIHGAASRFYKGIPISADGPEGTTVEWTACQESAMADLAVKTAVTLVKSEKVAPEDIVILGVNQTLLATIRNRAGFPHGVFVRHASDFKGLERKAVILAASREIADESELAYVALSRPRVYLAVLGEPEIISWLQGL